MLASLAPNDPDQRPAERVRCIASLDGPPEVDGPASGSHRPPAHATGPRDREPTL